MINLLHHGKLTPREQEILDLVWQGLVDKSIAWKLNISVRTVEYYRRSIRDKFGKKEIAILYDKYHALVFS